jgi:hypothetical protein
MYITNKNDLLNKHLGNRVSRTEITVFLDNLSIYIIYNVKHS